MKHRRDCERAEVGGDEIKQDSELRNGFPILKAKVNYHELAQEKTNDSDEQVNEKTHASIMGNRFDCGSSGDKRDYQSQCDVRLQIVNSLLR